MERMRAANWPEDRIQSALKAREVNERMAKAGAKVEEPIASPGPSKTVPQPAPNGTQTETACPLCGTPVRKEKAQYIANGTYRHKGCDPCAQERAEVAREEEGADMAKGKKAVKATQKGARETQQSAPVVKSERKPGLAAIQVMKATGKPMNCKYIVKVILAKKLWETTGKTPDATL